MEYNYFENVKEDIKSYVKENYESLEEVNEQSLYDDLFIADSVTGNASGSYYCNAWKAEEAICHNLDLAQEAYSEFGYDGIPFQQGAEAIDVTIRCYMIPQCLGEALEELESEEW